MRLPGRQARDDRHLLVAQLEVEQRRCCRGCADGRHRLRDGDDAVLDVPAQHHLGGGAVLRLGDAGRWPGRSSRPLPCPIGLQASVAISLLGVVVAQRLLGEPRVQLDLVDRRADPGLLAEPVQVVLGEVRDPDGAHPAVGVQLLQSARQVSTYRCRAWVAASGSGRGRSRSRPSLDMLVSKAA